MLLWFKIFITVIVPYLKVFITIDFKLYNITLALLHVIEVIDANGTYHIIIFYDTSL